MSGHVEWFLFLLLYNMTEFQLLNTRISAWPSVLEEWGQHLGEMVVSGVPFLAVFSAAIQCGYKCLMNETFSMVKVCGECLKVSLLFILLSIFKWCLEEGSWNRLAALLYCTGRNSGWTEKVFFLHCDPPVFVIFAIVTVMLCCLNVPSQNLSVWIINVFPHHVDTFWLFTMYAKVQSHLSQGKFSSYSQVVQAVFLNWYYCRSLLSSGQLCGYIT